LRGIKLSVKGCFIGVFDVLVERFEPCRGHDENGEGPKKPKNSRVAWAIYGISKVTYKSIIASNNTSIREVEKWALEERGYDKSTPWKLKAHYVIDQTYPEAQATIDAQTYYN
jgi:hypothetical protein